MRITLEDGEVIERAFSPGACVGYRAEAIEMEPADFHGFAAFAERDLAGFQAAMRQLASRLPGGRPNAEAAEAISLVQLCGACPEAYNAFLGERQVGYLRLRHGTFTVECPDSGGKTVLKANPEGDGLFYPDERARYLELAKAAIAEELSRMDNDEDSTFSVYADAVMGR